MMQIVQQRHAKCFTFTLFTAMMTLAGCASAPNGPGGTDQPEAPDYAALARVQNERVTMLHSLYSRGVLEVQWTDEDGTRHREPQVDLDLYLMPRRRTAFRASKVGEMYLWIGSDEERFWIFNMLGDERELFHASHAEASDGTLHPLLIRDLMGLVLLPTDEPAVSAPVEYDAEQDAWTVLVPGSAPGWHIRLFFDRAGRLPSRAEAVRAHGKATFTSEIRRYRRSPQDGMASVRFPQMPTLIDITGTLDADDVTRIHTVKIALDSPTGRIDDQPMDRVFDLDRLIQSLGPARVTTP